MDKFINLLAATDVNTEVNNIVNKVIGYFNIGLGAILTGVLMLGIFYGIKLGIRFAKAEDTEARDKAKQQLTNLIIGIAVGAIIIIVAIILINTGALNGLFAKIGNGEAV